MNKSNQLTTVEASEAGRALVAQHRQIIYSTPELMPFVNEYAVAMQRLTGGSCMQDGQIVALTMWCEGLTPIEFTRKYHLIQGKPVMRADAMLVELEQKGGSFEVVEKSANRAAIKIVSASGRKGEFQQTWEEAKESRWPWRDWRDHSKGLKDNWSTPTDRRTMLWSRCVSDAIRTIEPSINAGTYTVEEMMDVVDGRVVSSTVVPVDMDAITDQAAKDAEQEAGEVVDAEYTTTETAEPDLEAESEPATDACTMEQRELIRELFIQVGANDDDKQRAIEKRGAKSLQTLSPEAADDLIASIKGVLAKKS